MRTNAHCTIYNKYVDPSTRKEVWTRYQVRDVAWENRKAANVLRSGNLEADQAAIYIPLANMENYLSPRDWEALTSKAGKWTLRQGDMIVNGLVADNITSTFTISDLERKYNDVLTIRSVDRMDQGRVSMHHYQIGAS